MRNPGPLYLFIVAFAAIAPARAYQLNADAVAPLGGVANGGGFALGSTAGLPVIGRATNPNVVEVAGFWFGITPPTSSAEEPPSPSLPRSTRLGRSAPNPFTRKTRLHFRIAGRAGELVPARLEVFDVSGRRVAVLVDEPLSPGRYEVSWGGRGMASGIFFARLRAGEYQGTKRLVAAF